MAITDHDNCDGVGEFLSACAETDLCADGAVRLAGIELSVDPGKGYGKFHLLGLGIDPENAGLKSFLRRVLEGRNRRNRRIIGNFRRLGIDIDEDELSRYAHGDVLARPHFARYLFERGFAADIRTAFEKYLLPDSPRESICYEERWHPPQEEAFRVIHAAGGVCVMAHPKYWRDAWKRTAPDYAAAERELARLKECGLDGLECLYQAQTDAENAAFAAIAGRLGLLKSAGSDFHGANKANTLGMTVEDAFIGPLLERL
jgi:predicted metal-dependent phosphoesterase TrpH